MKTILMKNMDLVLAAHNVIEIILDYHSLNTKHNNDISKNRYNSIEL